MSSLNKSHIVVTGATSGIGLATAAACLSQGASVTIIGRCEQTLERTRQGLKQQLATGARLRSEVCDLSSMRDVRALVGRLLLLEPVDVLISNAGVQPWSRQQTAEGVELTFATNVLAHHVLVNGLTRSIAASRLKCVVATGSMVHRWAKLDWCALNNPEPFDPQQVYARSKAELLLLQTAFAVRLAPLDIGVHTLEPGMTRTNFARHFEGFDRLMARLWQVFMRRPEAVAQDFVTLLRPDDLSTTPNRYWYKSKPKTPAGFAIDASSAKRLMDHCQSLVDEMTP